MNRREGKLGGIFTILVLFALVSPLVGHHDEPPPPPAAWCSTAPPHALGC